MISTQSSRIVVMGYIVRGPMGGMAWHHLQYVLGLARLGHDVYFIEDSDDYPSCYDPTRNCVDADPSCGIAFTSIAFEKLGLPDRWAYCDAHTSRWLGPLAEHAIEICSHAEVLLNVSGVNPLRPWLESIPVRVLIDTDPAFIQIRHLQRPAARKLAARHNAYFSFGENIQTTASIPDDGFPWRPTRQPIVLSSWPMTRGSADGKYTTVMQWNSYAPVVHGGRSYGMKSMSFAPFIDLPRRAGRCFELAIGNPPDELASAGWLVTNPFDVTRDPWTYQDYLMQSKAEFSVAKQGYVTSHSGWFSERSACYLACGRPVLVQNTGFTDWLTAGEGVVPFETAEEALAGIAAINSRYAEHCESARQIAEA
jgi:hypothetical protein